MAASGHQKMPAARASTSATKGLESQSSRSPQDFDHRQLGGTALVKAQRAVTRQQSVATQRYLASLGGQAIVDYDPLTGTPRELGRLDGFLSGPHRGSARTIALDFVRSHLDALGLTSSDLSTLVFRKDYVDTAGIHHLSWIQRVDGTTVFGNGLQVNVTRHGRVISVLGSPVSGLASMVRQAPSASLSATQARSDAAKNVDGRVQSQKVASSTGGASSITRWSNHDFSEKVWFVTSAGLRPAWSTYVQTGDNSAYQHVIDAATGKALYRHSTSDSASGSAYVYDYYPGAPNGPKYGRRHHKKRTTPGQPMKVNFINRGWLSKHAKTLDGTNVITWADVNDDNRVNPGEQTKTPGTKHGATGRLKTFPDTSGVAGDGPFADYDFSKFCTKSFPCTWDPWTGFSWKKNLAANENNAFYLANTYHDYLQKDRAIGFTPRAGNFTAAGGDPVLQQVLDGANTYPPPIPPGLPDFDHIDNANMNTPPDGIPPTMQMYLWHATGNEDDWDPYVATSGAFDASVLLHEYTHGLSNRLVVDADGNSTLNSLQAGSMGEAWSDYYAMDYLVTHHFQKDTARDGEVFEGQYLEGAQRDSNGKLVPFRSMAIDCSVGSTSRNCYNTYNPNDPHPQGGYTYGDLVTIGGSAEVHSSGEVWAQTLWDIRKRFGHTIADTDITRGMSLSASDPSMLDMRNAILQADQAVYGGSHTASLWAIFAKRGMGFYAGSIGSADTDVAEDFHRPPNPKTHNDSQFIQGTVTDSETGDPVAGATVTVTGFGDSLSAVTRADGTYSIGSTWGMYPGTYPKVVVQGAGYLQDSQSVTVPVGDYATADFSVQRDWAMDSGGGTVTDFNGPDYSGFGCGPAGAIDGSLGTGWGSTAGNEQGDPTGTFEPKHVVVKLPQAVDVSGFGVDPQATCGDSGSSSTGDYSIEVSANGSDWTTVAEGHFGEDARGHLNQVDPTGDTSGVQYVRFTIKGDQVVEAARDNGDDTGTFASICGDPTQSSGYTGCQFADMSELAVFGTPTPTP